LDAVVIAAGGRTNPYKDARMSAATYRAGYPRWRELEAARDPAISSNFWRRVASTRSVSAPPLAPVNPAFEPAVQPKSVEPASKESQ
ncbi:hypothetical protein N9H93_06595, partial [Rhizobiaceae bacterium]|nr:hypothetical protein [Rhizobiaceae bacterium]